jgi:DNA-binding protein H-NS
MGSWTALQTHAMLPKGQTEPKGAVPLDQSPEPAAAPAAPQPATSPRQRAAIIHRIRTLMEFWGITVTQLRHFKAKPPVQAPAASPKYRHPTTGATWDGQGPQPEWLRNALLKEGFTVEHLRQASAAATGLPTEGGTDEAGR